MVIFPEFMHVWISVLPRVCSCVSNLYLPCHFACEIVMLNWMRLKLFVLVLDTFRSILICALWFLSFWIVRYDFLNRGVTMCVTTFMSNVLIFVTMLYEHELSCIFAWGYLWVLRMHVNFSGIFECISYLIDNFSPVWPIVDFLWVMILFDLGNSGG